MPELERENLPQPLPDQPPSTDPVVQVAQRDLATGIHMLTRDWDSLDSDFVDVATRIAKTAEAPARVQAMMQFALVYHRLGLEISPEALRESADEIRRTAGVPVKIEMPQQLEREARGETTVFGGERSPNPPRDGLLVGIVGADVPKGGGQEPRLRAIALIENSLEQPVFVPVSLYPTGRIIIRPEIYYPEFQERHNTPRRMIEALFPPTRMNLGRDGGARRIPERARGGGRESGPNIRG